ncbi:DEAD/DEAH box helicase [Liberiplasma polymorphum]|uniref:DEAD/DEAH box helicase n=1 Tax=Liberiplasma polymorphum TaxID=3374570 RepID=UPI00377084E2
MQREQYHEPKLITNQKESTFYEELASSLKTCNRFYFSVAFINYSGLQLLLDLFQELDNNSIKGKVITSTYLNFTDIKSLRKLTTFNHIETKIYIANRYKGFHTKGYIFEYDDYYKIIIGSSNITQSALKTNIEWNVRYITKHKQDDFASEIINEFETLWDLTSDINEDFLNQYESFLSDIEEFVKKEKELFEVNLLIKENSMQLKALENLTHLRQNNQNKALVIAATGTGKTYLSAFDVKQFNPKKVLFLIHREVILDEAMKSFQRIHPTRLMSKYSGSNKDLDGEFVFAMVQTLYSNENYKQFDPETFDYIIADEAHRSFSPSYKSIIEYFNPKFLLGMTATPERTDGGNIFELFNNNIALEIRLRDSLRDDLVLPFHYFGITDITTDLAEFDISRIDEMAEKLSIKERVDFVIEKMEHYGFSGSKRKALGFCVNKAHAVFMANEFNAFGYPSVCLTGDTSEKERKDAIKRLENLNDDLEFIFTVDIFNEGVDIPTVNLVLMLRPTQSPIIFTQQLGRGLRKHYEKEFLTVLDFIGNHNKSFLIPIALSGSRYYDKDSLKVQLAKNFSDIPGCTHIQLDQIAKDQILSQLERINFTDMRYLQEEYLEFKKNLGGNIPKLLDYIGQESSPDPTKFILKANSYIEFIEKVENTENNYSETLLKVQRSLDKQLPIKRINEFVIIKHLFTYGTVDYQTAKQEILKIISDVDTASIKHAFKYLSGLILGGNETDPFWYIDGNGVDSLILKEKDLIKNASIMDTLDYGILRYQEEFGKDKLEYPYLKKYTYYKMKDMGFLTNYQKSFASIRGSGVWRNGNHFYLFVDLHKGEEISESINYKDKLISPSKMQWQTQNKTSQDSETGQDLFNNKERNIKLHMFLRKAKQIGNQKLDYMYIGEVNSISYEGNKPITIQMEIFDSIPKQIFDDLTFI